MATQVAFKDIPFIKSLDAPEIFDVRTGRQFKSEQEFFGEASKFFGTNITDFQNQSGIDFTFRTVAPKAIRDLQAQFPDQTFTQTTTSPTAPPPPPADNTVIDPNSGIPISRESFAVSNIEASVEKGGSITEQLSPARLDAVNAGLTANDAFINALFTVFHGRDANAGELSKFTGQTVGSARDAIKAGSPLLRTPSIDTSFDVDTISGGVTDLNLPDISLDFGAVGNITSNVGTLLGTLQGQFAQISSQIDALNAENQKLVQQRGEIGAVSVGEIQQQVFNQLGINKEIFDYQKELSAQLAGFQNELVDLGQQQLLEEERNFNRKAPNSSIRGRAGQIARHYSILKAGVAAKAGVTAMQLENSRDRVVQARQIAGDVVNAAVADRAAAVQELEFFINRNDQFIQSLSTKQQNLLNTTIDIAREELAQAKEDMRSKIDIMLEYPHADFSGLDIRTATLEDIAEVVINSPTVSSDEPITLEAGDGSHYQWDAATNTWFEIIPALGDAADPTKDLKQNQFVAAGFARRIEQSDQVISELEQQFSEITAIGGFLPNFLKSSDRQRYEQAQRNFVNAVLRRESGAVISEEEFENARKQYFPQPGDTNAVVTQKKENRRVVLEAMRNEAGPAFDLIQPSNSSVNAFIKQGRDAGKNSTTILNELRNQFIDSTFGSEIEKAINDPFLTPDDILEYFEGQQLGLNRPQRNNNPVNVKLGGVADQFAMRDASGNPMVDDQGHLIFPDAEAGFRGAEADIRAKVEGRSRFLPDNPTINQLGSVFAEDPNWPRSVASILGVSTDTRTQDIPFEALLDAIATQEGFFA